MIRSAAFILLIFSLLLACGKQDQPVILTKDEMAAMLVDFYLREARLKSGTVGEDSAAVIFSHLRRAFAGKKGISDSVIDESFNYYMARPRELQDVYTRVIDTLALREQRAYSTSYQ